MSAPTKLIDCEKWEFSKSLQLTHDTADGYREELTRRKRIRQLSINFDDTISLWSQLSAIRRELGRKIPIAIEVIQ